MTTTRIIWTHSDVMDINVVAKVPFSLHCNTSLLGEFCVEFAADELVDVDDVPLCRLGRCDGDDVFDDGASLL